MLRTGCLLLGLLSTAPPREQPREVERDVIHADGGYQVEEAPQATAAENVLPPVLRVPSPAVYPPGLASSPVAGKVDLELLVDESGAVQEARVAASVHPLLDAAALRAAQGLQFEPARVHGAPAPVRIHFAYVFSDPSTPLPVARLRGAVRSWGNRNPIPGAHLSIGATLTTDTDATGHFELPVTAGSATVRISAPGYRAAEVQETIQSGQALEVAYALEPLRAKPYQTVVRGERARIEVSRVTLHDQELREVPGTMGDPFRVVMLLPGVASLASGVSYPIVRGTEPASTGYFLDGIQLPSLFHLVLGPAVVHPDFIDSVDFYPGPVPIKYGRLMGGAVDGTVARTRDDRLHVTAYADLINAGGLIELPFPSTGTNITLAGRISYAPWILSRVAGLFPQPGAAKVTPQADLYDYQARIEQKVGNGRLRLLALGSSDVVGLNTHYSDGSAPDNGQHLTSVFHRVDLRYRQPLGIGEGEVGLTYGFERIGIDNTQQQVVNQSYSLAENSVSGRLAWTANLAPTAVLSFGGDVQTRRSQTIALAPTAGDPAKTATFTPPLALSTTSGAYAQLAWKPNEKWTVVPALRVDNYYLAPGVDFASLDPRITALFAVNPQWTLKAGAAWVHQAPTVLLNLPVLDAASLRYGLQSGAQFDVGAEWKSPFGFELSVDAYYDPIFRAVELNLGDVLQNSQRLKLPGYDPGIPGRAYGFEVLARHPIGDHWFGWVSYSFLRAERYQQFATFDSGGNVTGTAQGWVPFAFQESHVLNAALSYQFPLNITAGVVFHFNTGKPESGQISSRSQYPSTDPTTGNPIWVFKSRDQVNNLPSFYRIDARLSKTWIRKDYTLEAYVDVLNTTLNQEVIAYYYGTSGGGLLSKTPNQLPIVVPMLGLKFSY